MNHTCHHRFIFFLLLLSGFFQTQAQDLLVTQFDYVPMMTNPAQTGDFYGSFRLGGTYRDQGYTVTRNPYRAPSFAIDAPIMKGFRKKDWIGVGGYLMQDRAGAGQLSTGEYLFSAAYHFSLNDKAFRYLVIGIQGGTYQRSFQEGEALRFEDGIINGGVSMDQGLALAMGRARFSGAVGAMFRMRDEQENEFRFGAKVGRLFGHDYSVSSRGGRVNIPLRLVVHGAYDIQFGNALVLTPQAIGQFMGGFRDVTIQARARIPFNKEKEIYLNPGLGYRLGDAGQLLFGLQYKLIRASVAYDFTTSSLAQVNNGAGAIEFALAWIVRIRKQPEVTRRIFCPRF